MSQIKFEENVRSSLIQELQNYFEQELDRELGQFEADFLLDFIGEKLGGYFYNQGLDDAKAQLFNSMDNIYESIEVLSKDVD